MPTSSTLGSAAMKPNSPKQAWLVIYGGDFKGTGGTRPHIFGGGRQDAFSAILPIKTTAEKVYKMLFSEVIDTYLYRDCTRPEQYTDDAGKIGCHTVPYAQRKEIGWYGMSCLCNNIDLCNTAFSVQSLQHRSVAMMIAIACILLISALSNRSTGLSQNVGQLYNDNSMRKRRLRLRSKLLALSVLYRDQDIFASTAFIIFFNFHIFYTIFSRFTSTAALVQQCVEMWRHKLARHETF